MSFALCKRAAIPLMFGLAAHIHVYGQPVAEPLGGMVVNQTVTVNGQDFYKAFAAAWRDAQAASQYAVAIYERPNARHGTHVWVEYQRNKVYETILPPSRAQIPGLGVRAAEAAQEAIVNADVERRLYVDHDLAKDEI